MPINTNVPIPEDSEPPEQDSGKDIPMSSNDYRFTGYTIRRDDEGNILESRPHSSQPLFWTYRALRRKSTRVFRG